MAKLIPSSYRHQVINYKANNFSQINFNDTKPRVFQFKNYTQNTIYVSKNLIELQLDTNNNVINEYEYDFKIEQNTSKVFVSVLPPSKLYVIGLSDGIIEINSWECQDIDSNDLDQTEQIIINKNSNTTIFQTQINNYPNLLTDSSFEKSIFGNEIGYKTYKLVSDAWRTDYPNLTQLTQLNAYFGKQSVILDESNLYQYVNLPLLNSITDWTFTASVYANSNESNLTITLKFLGYSNNVLYQQSQTFAVNNGKFTQYKMTVSVPSTVNTMNIYKIYFEVYADWTTYIDDCQLVNYKDTTLYIPDSGMPAYDLFLGPTHSLQIYTPTTKLNNSDLIISRGAGTAIEIDSNAFPYIIVLTDGTTNNFILQMYSNGDLSFKLGSHEYILMQDGKIIYDSKQLANPNIVQETTVLNGTTVSIPATTQLNNVPGDILYSRYGSALVFGSDGHVYVQNSAGDIVLLV